MAYNVNHTDVANYGSLIVEDKTINNDTSLSLVGRFYPGYSKHISENFLHLLENFASNSSPSNPSRGQLWFNTDSNSNPPQPKLMVWSGSSWMPVGLVTRSNDAPTSIEGDLWIDPNNKTLKMWGGTTQGWITFLTNIDSSGSGIKTERITDNGRDPDGTPRAVLEHDVIVAYIADKEYIADPSAYPNYMPKTVAIYSWDPEFTPNNWNKFESFTGSTIKPGINIPSSMTFVGWSEKAIALKNGSNTITSSDLFIKNQTNETTGNIVVKNSNGIIVSNTTSTRNINIKPNANDITVTSNTDLILISNSGPSPTELKLLPSSFAFNKPVNITGLLTSTNISTTNLSASLLTVNSAIINDKIEITSTGKILPLSDMTIYGYIGDNTQRWNTIYSNTIDANYIGNAGTEYLGKLKDTVTLNGKSILNSATTFNLTQDIIGSAVAGSNTTVNINASLYSHVISNQTEITSILPTDLILVERSSGLKYVSIDNFNISNTLIGSILLYAGTAIPDKYKLCNGQSLSKSTYSELFSVIGSTYGSTSTTFNVPTVTHTVSTLKYYIYAGKN